MSLEVSPTLHDARSVGPHRDEENSRSPANSMRMRVFRFFFKKTTSLISCVIAPSIVAAVYYFAIASGQYVSETRLVVRTIGISESFDTSEKRDGRSVIGGDSLTQDSYIVANYLRSPQIVRNLEARIGLRAIFSRSDIDWLSRLPGDASFEALYRYWLKHIETYVDGPSGIIIFTVRAFSPQDSVAISSAALEASNEMIEKISEKAKNDLVGRGEHEVKASLHEYQQALDDLREYQNATGILDPISSAKMASTIITKLTEEKLRLSVDLKSLEAANADKTARGRQLRRSIQALDDEIQIRQNSIAGKITTGETRLSSSLSEFSRLETRRIVNQTLYEATVRNLDTARSTALKRTTFISIFSNAHVPDEATYPDRFSQWIVLTAGLFTLWMTATLVWMSIEDHRV